MITADGLRVLLDYDADSGVFTWRVSQGTKKAGSIAGYPGARGAILIGLCRKRHQAHRLAWLHIYGEWPPEQIDHINGNPTDNRLANLRLATPSQNLANKRRYRNNTSGAKGVYWNKQYGKWRAKISVNGRRMFLGSFDSKEDAAAAYARAAAEYFGAFARLE